MTTIMARLNILKALKIFVWIKEIIGIHLCLIFRASLRKKLTIWRHKNTLEYVWIKPMHFRNIFTHRKH